MTQERMTYLENIEACGADHGWVAPLDKEDIAYFAHFREVCRRYNINPGKATRLEYDFVVRVTESEFYLKTANA